jgi:hypothetical protein
VPKFVVPYGQPCLLGPPLTASFLGHSWLLGTGQDPEGRMASSVLLCIVPKDQIFDAPRSLRGPASSYRRSAEVSWIA